jgi:hypothetical protein
MRQVPFCSYPNRSEQLMSLPGYERRTYPDGLARRLTVHGLSLWLYK